MHPSPLIVGLLTTSPQNVSAEDYRPCGLIEVRFDLILDFDQNDFERQTLEIIQQVRKIFPDQALMATLRLERDGGRWPEDLLSMRAPVFRTLIESEEFDWVDFEREEPELFELAGTCLDFQVQMLCSHHNFQGSYSSTELETMTQEMEILGASAAKFALTFQEASQEEELYHFLNHRSDHFVLAAFSMGELGQASRVIAPLLGASATYGFVGQTPSAPGQWSIDSLGEFFNLYPEAQSTVMAQGFVQEFLSRETSV